MLTQALFQKNPQNQTTLKPYTKETLRFSYTEMTFPLKEFSIEIFYSCFSPHVYKTKRMHIET